MKFEAFLPLDTVLLKAEGLIKYFQESIAEFLWINNLTLSFIDFGEVACELSFIQQYKPKSDKNLKTCSALAFKIEIQEKEIEATIFTGEEEIKTSSLENFIAAIEDEFNVQLQSVLLLMELAKPGAIKSREGDLYINGEFYNGFKGLHSIHQETYNDVKANGWPKYKNLKYTEVFSWFKKFNFSFEGSARNKTEIALNAYSYLFEYNYDYILDLFWSLVGIEALYCSGKEGKAEQIFEKTQIVLGPITDFKKKLKDMYNFRSRLIHGDLPIPSFISKEFSLTEVEKYNEDFYQATVFAVAILTATLQELVYLYKDTLAFRTVLA